MIKQLLFSESKWIFDELRLGTGQQGPVTKNFTLQIEQRRAGFDQPPPDVQPGIAGNRPQKPDTQVSGDPLHPVMKQAMGHRRIEQGTDDASVEDTVIPLQPVVGLKLRLDIISLPAESQF